MMLKGAANTLVERTTQIHPRSSIRAVRSFARTWVRRTTKKITPTLNKKIILKVKNCKSNHSLKLVILIVVTKK